MEIAFILLFIGAVFVFGVCRGFHKRSKGENVYYALALIVCLAVLMLKSLDVWQFDPVNGAIEFFHKHGLIR